MKRILPTVCLCLIHALSCWAGDPSPSADFDLGRMLIVGFRGTEVNSTSDISMVLRDMHPGGIMLLDYDVPSHSRPRNITGPDQVRRLIRDLKAQSVRPLLVAVDAEGGRVNRLKSSCGFEDFPAPAELGQGSQQRTFAVAGRLAGELAGLGFDVNFAPVVDVNINPDNPIIGRLGRSFSADPEIVVAHAHAFIRAHHEHGLLTAIKHFPGHGSSTGDTHIGLVDVTDTYRDEELVPFRKLLRKGEVDMVMTAHVMNRRVDPDWPVTLSTRYIEPILRQRFGYDGVVVSDDLQMGAIVEHYSLHEALVRAVNAGCDMLILSNNGKTYDPFIAYKAVLELNRAVDSGEISRERVESAMRRITSLMARKQ